MFNREEKILRETLLLDHFTDDPNIIGGRDKKEGGTWLGLNVKTGNIAFLTNYEWKYSHKILYYFKKF